MNFEIVTLSESSQAKIEYRIHESTYIKPQNRQTNLATDQWLHGDTSRKVWGWLYQEHKEAFATMGTINVLTVVMASGCMCLSEQIKCMLHFKCMPFTAGQLCLNKTGEKITAYILQYPFLDCPFSLAYWKSFIVMKQLI